MAKGLVGYVLVAQGEIPEAFSSFRKCLAIREALAAGDPANTQWQLDEARCCATLGTLVEAGIAKQLAYLKRGQGILLALRNAGRLLTNQDFTEFFEKALLLLDEMRPDTQEPRPGQLRNRMPIS